MEGPVHPPTVSLVQWCSVQRKRQAEEFLDYQSRVGRRRTVDREAESQGEWGSKTCCPDRVSNSEDVIRRPPGAVAEPELAAIQHQRVRRQAFDLPLLPNCQAGHLGIRWFGLRSGF